MSWAESGVNGQGVASYQAQVDARRAQTRASRQHRREEALRVARQALADAVSKPLIDATLLTQAEQREVAERVRSSGQRSWGIKGGV